ncbi:hypothetical protein BDV93DRAFT_344136 [Ceratobasidium sp. AG-I]|nr:hypothetical protein BDV93DRAFT_344136 [Ceratobasidium sp. AG-I]
MIRELEPVADCSFITLLKSNWVAIDSVEAKYMKKFCDRAANALVTRFTNALMESRPTRGLASSSYWTFGHSGLHSRCARNVTKNTLKLETLLYI